MAHKILIVCLLLACFGADAAAQTSGSSPRYKSRSKRSYKYYPKKRVRTRAANGVQTELQNLDLPNVEINSGESPPTALPIAQKNIVQRTAAFDNEFTATKPLPFKVEHPLAMQTMLEKTVADTIAKFADKKLNGENIAVTLIDLRDPNNLKSADYHGEIKIYPASVVKLFYLAAAHRWLEDDKLQNTPELQRGLRDMIVDSSNDATGYIVDALAGVGSGAELLAPAEFEGWAFKRNAVNRYFTALGYTNINVNQKAFCEDAYGLEQQFRGKDGVNRNKLTTNATARLLTEIVLKRAVTPARSEQMLELLKRDPAKETADILSQDTAFTGAALKEANVKLWSKAGWTSTTRHDAAYVETADNLKFVIVTFTENVASEREIIPTIARALLEEMRKTAKNNGGKSNAQ